MNAARSYGMHDSDVFAGLRAPKKRLPSRLLYDERGSELYDRLTHLDAHYLTRTELVLLRTHLSTIASHVGAGARLVEPGVTGPLESRMVLNALDAPAVFVPIAICPERLANTVEQRDRMIRNFLSAVVSGIRDDDPGVGGGCDIHVVDSNGIFRDHLAAR